MEPIEYKKSIWGMDNAITGITFQYDFRQWFPNNTNHFI